MFSAITDKLTIACLLSRETKKAFTRYQLIKAYPTRKTVNQNNFYKGDLNMLALNEKKVNINEKDFTQVTVSFPDRKKPFIFLIPGNDKKFYPDLKRVISILNNGIDILSFVDKMQLLSIYNISYHSSGKIEGIFSLDSTATNCLFCDSMRNVAKNNQAHICGMCYDFAQEQYKVQALNRHSLNLMIMSTVEFSVEELATLTAGELVRINSSGDIENIIHAKNMIKYAISHPFSSVALWAKNTVPVISACDELGKPKNITLIQSSCIIGNIPKKAKYFDYVFVVYANKNSIEKAINSGACECNGKKCRECGFKCYKKLWPCDSVIAEYLRGIDASKRKTISELTQGGEK